MTDRNAELLHGSLELLILRLLQTQRRHGYEIAKRIQLLSKDAFVIGQGSLYPALHRLVKKGYIVSSWGESDTGRKVRVYELTPAGARRVADETSHWRQFCDAINVILQEG